VTSILSWLFPVRQVLIIDSFVFQLSLIKVKTYPHAVHQGNNIILIPDTGKGIGKTNPMMNMFPVKIRHSPLPTVRTVLQRCVNQEDAGKIPEELCRASRWMHCHKVHGKGWINWLESIILILLQLASAGNLTFHASQALKFPISASYCFQYRFLNLMKVTLYFDSSQAKTKGQSLIYFRREFRCAFPVNSTRGGGFRKRIV